MKYRVLIDTVDVTNIALVDGFEILRNAHESISTARMRFEQRLDAGDKFAARTWKEWSSVVIQEAPGTYTTATPRRYWRMLVTSAYTPGQTVAVEEVEFLSPDGTVLSTGGTASASSSTGVFTPDRAFDANSTTFWQSGAVPSGSAPQWIAYDFGTLADVAEVRIIYVAGNIGLAPGVFAVEYSSDGTAWTSAAGFTADWSAAGADRALSFVVLRRRFSGFISELQREPDDNEKFAVSVACVDLAVMLDRKVSASLFTSTSDRDVVKELAEEADSGLTILDANIDFSATIAEFDARDMIIREALERLCEITGCRWHVDSYNALHYYKPGIRFSPFNLSDAPDGLVSMPYQMTDFRREFSNSANRITLLGGIGEDGTPIRVTRDDTASITEFGVLEAITIDREVTATAVAIMKADADLAQRAQPRISGRAVVREPVEFWRLDLGQTIGIESALYGVDGNFVIVGIREFIDVYTNAAFEVEWGAREADIVSTFRMLMRESPDLPEAVIGPDTVIPGENIVGVIGGPGSGVTAIHAEKVTGTFIAGQVIMAGENIQGVISGELVTVDATTIEGLISGDEVFVSGQTITGAITGEDVTIGATAITGVIVGAQLTDQILDTLRLVGPGMGVVERVPSAAALPTLPNLEYPIGSIILQSAIYGVSHYGTARYGSTLYEANADNTWHVTSASANLTGLIKAGDIDSVNANSIIGVIVASQIQSITAGQITGIIQGDQIGIINATSITAVNAEAITGDINAANIVALNAGDITMVTLWDETQIGSVSASSITAGTITALVTMTSPDIQVTGDGYNFRLKNTTGMTVTATGMTRTLKLTNAGIVITGDPGDTTVHNERGMDTGHPTGSSGQVASYANEALIAVQYTPQSAVFEAKANNGGVAVTANSATGSVTVNFLGNSYLYAKHLSCEAFTTALAMPTSYTKYFNLYDSLNNVIGKVPIF